MSLRRLLVLSFAAMALAACVRHTPHDAASPANSMAMAQSDLDIMAYGRARISSETAQRAGKIVPVRGAAKSEGGTYTLDAGDKVRVMVFGQDTLSNSYTVDASGRITMPLIGAVSARGLTPTQLSGAIASQLKQSFIRDPSVAVEIEVYRPFFVLGEVTYPGQYPYVPNMTVENAIAIAGGFTPRASKNSVTVRRMAQGDPISHDRPLQYPLRPGDTVTVSERWF